MGYFINSRFGYITPDRLDPSDIEVPERPSRDHVWENGAWAIPLADAQAVQTAVIDAACQAAIYAGFSSSALGATYSYPAKDKDQQNLSASVIDAIADGQTSGWTTSFWCADATGVWAFRPHTAAQIIQVGKDAKAAVLAAQTKCVSLKAEIAAAATIEAVQAVAWS